MRQNNFLSVLNPVQSLALSVLVLCGLSLGVNAVLAQSAADAQPSKTEATGTINLPGQPGEPPTLLRPVKTKPDLAYGAFQRGYYLSAFNYALPRAQMGDAAAQTLIGELYEKGLGIRRDPKEATRWYRLAAAGGSPDAQFSYALKLLEGKYVERDDDAARDLMKRSADAGHGIAQFNYAQILVEERPTSRGFEIALGYFDGAARRGVAEAYFSMAQIYIRGFGTKGGDEAKARPLMLKAAKNGVINAQIELAIWMANGRGGDKDLKGAFSWFRVAANKGNVIAQNRLSRMLVLGLGTDIKPVEAAKWYVLARRRGHKDAMLDAFFNSLAPELQNQALAAANRWPAK